MTTLGDLAHARAGDKGDTSILVVAPYEPDDYPGNVTVHPVPRLGAFTVVVRDRLDGGVTRSRAADPHGKTLSGHLLDLAVEG